MDLWITGSYCLLTIQNMTTTTWALPYSFLFAIKDAEGYQCQIGVALLCDHVGGGMI